jgi:hypothetical protein
MPYISSFFSLPVKRRSGERLTHEEVVNKLDTETVSYDAALGITDQFSEVLRISLKVEMALYETAVAWLRDLICGSEFDKERSESFDSVLSRIWADTENHCLTGCKSRLPKLRSLFQR